MRIDLYTKIILTALTVTLAVIAVTPFVAPAQVRAQSNTTPPSGAQFVVADGLWYVYDPQHPAVWIYKQPPLGSDAIRGNAYHFRLSELKPPLGN